MSHSFGHASHSYFKKFDRSKIGTGVGVNRYAEGVYLGDCGSATVSSYLDKYAGSDSVHTTYEVDGKCIDPSTDLYEALNQPLLDTDDIELKYGTQIADFCRNKSIQSYQGVGYEVTMPDDVYQSLHHWGDVVDDELLNTCAAKILGAMGVKWSEKVLAQLTHLGFEDPVVTDIEEILEVLAENALEEGSESDMPYYVEHEHILDYFSRLLRNDTYTIVGSDDDVIPHISDKYIDVIGDMTDDRVCFQSEFTYGDLYNACAHCLKASVVDDGRTATSEFLEQLDIAGFIAPAMEGESGANEVIVTGKSAIGMLRFEQLSREEMESKFQIEVVRGDYDCAF
ncbi:hypothetical protein AB4254_08590 [Vibrio breoganii]